MITKTDIEIMVNEAQIKGFQINIDQIELLTWNKGPLNHVPTKKSKEDSAVYIFKYIDIYLKVGRVGSNSNERYQYHHYNGGANSTLAKSLSTNDQYMQLIGNDNIGSWIKENTDRYNILFPSDIAKYFSPVIGKYFSQFVENYFISKCSPLFEGKQRK